ERHRVLMFLLDTNVISETRKPRANDGLMRWISDVGALDLHLSVLSIGEIRKGIERLRQPDSLAAADIEEWLDHVKHACGDRVLPIDRSIAHEWGLPAATGDDHPVDIMLAATAHTYNLTLVTRNVRHVPGLGIGILNPFSA